MVLCVIYCTAEPLCPCITVPLCLCYHCTNVPLFYIPPTILELYLCSTLPLLRSAAVPSFHLCKRFSMLMCHCLTILLFLCSHLSQLCQKILSYLVTVPLFHCGTVALWYCATIQLCVCSTVPLFYGAIVSHCHCSTVTLYHTTTVP